MANDGLYIEAGLDINRTIQNINSELKEIQAKIDKLKVNATLDKSESKKDIEKELLELNKQKKKLEIELNIKKDTLKKQYKEIEKQNNFKLNLDTNSATDGINRFNTILNDTNTSTITLASSLKNALNSVGIYTTAYQALQLVRTMANEAKEAVEEFDGYLTNIKMIAGVDDAKAQQMLSDYNDKAVELKVDISDVAQANEVILRAGKNLEESGQYLESSIKLAKTGFINSDSAAANLVVISNSYDLTADKLQNVADTLLYLDSNSNVTAGELSKAVATAAKNADMAGIGFQKLASMIAVIKNDTGKTENEAATALNKILSRSYNVKLNNYLAEAESDGTSTEEVIKSINDLEKILDSIGVKVRDNKKEFRDFADIIGDLAPKFKQLSSVEQNSVAFALGGAAHKNTVKSLVDDWNSVLDLEQKATNAISVTDEKYGKYLESITAQNTTIQTSLKNLWNNLLPSEDLKNVKDATVNIIEFTDKYQILQTLIRGTALYALCKSFVLVKNGLSGTIANLSSFNTAMKLTKTSGSLTEKQIDNLAAACKNLSDNQLRSVLSSESLTAAQRLEVLQATGLTQAEAKAKIETLGLATAETTAAATTTSLKSAVSGLFKTISAHPLGLIITAITTLISVFSIYKKKQEEAAQKAEENRQKIKEEAEAAKEESKNIDDLISQYEKYQDITSLTAEDKENLKSIQDKLIETFGKEADGIDLVNGKYEEQIAKLKELSLEKLKQNENTLIANRDNAKDTANDNKTNKIAAYTLKIGVDGNEYDVESRIKGITKEIIDDLSNIDGFDLIFSDVNDSEGNYEHTIATLNLDALNSEDKIKAITAALEYLKENNATDNELFQYLVSLQNHYQEEVDELQSATDDLANNIVNQYVLKYGSPENLSIDEYNKWINDLLNTIADDDVKEAVKSIVTSMYSGEILQGNKTLSYEVLGEADRLKDSLSQYKENIEDYLSEKSKLDSAIKEQNENGNISSNTAWELINNGYASAIKVENGEYKLLESEINKVTKARNEETLAKLKSAKADAVSKQQAEINRLEKLLNSHISNPADVELYKNKLAETKTGLNGVIAEYDLYISMLETSGDATSKFADVISNTTSKINEYAESFDKMSSAQSNLKSALEEQEKYGRLSGSTIKSLIDAGYANALSYNAQTGETILLTDAVDDLTKAQIANKKVEIQKSIDETTESLKQAREEYSKIGSYMNSGWNAQYYRNEYNAIGQSIDNLESSLQDLNGQQMMWASLAFSFDEDSTAESAEKAAEDAIQAVKDAVGKKEANLKHLLSIDVITEDEYYDDLLELVNEYYKDKKEYLDEYQKYEEEIYDHLKKKQLDAIDEQINALKSVNEEKQAEIDLEKARQALENAKKQKNIKVYDSERGWINETNREEIDSAQKDYDDKLLDKQVSVLEDLKESIENGKNTAHSDNENVDIQKQVDSLTPEIPTRLSSDEAMALLSKTIGMDINSREFKDKMRVALSQATVETNRAVMPNVESPIAQTLNNNNNLTVNVDKVVTDNPQNFISQMEDIANKSFKANFPPAMDEFADGLRRYRMNHKGY